VAQILDAPTPATTKGGRQGAVNRATAIAECAAGRAHRPGQAPDRGRRSDHGSSRSCARRRDQDPPATLSADPRFLADELADHLAGKAPGDLVFTAPEGGVLRNTNFRPRFFDPAAEKVGLLGLTPHELRHTAASLAIAAGANVKAVQLMLGHASGAMTLDIYAGLFADDLDAVADRLDRAFVKVNADQMRTKWRTSRSDQTERPFENPPEQGTG